MSLQVSVGNLANDGARFNPTVELAAFVNSTRAFNFGLEEFVGGDVSFIVSQTDAPATAIVNRALTWFKRGAGVLYHAHFFTPIEGTHSGTTQWRWVAASGSRKEMIVEYRFPVQETGGLLRQTGEREAGIYGVQVMANRFMMPRVIQTLFTSHTDMSLTSDTTASWMAYWAAHHNDPIFVALDTTEPDPGTIGVDPCGWSGHDFKVAVECGFCEIAVSSEYTGPGKLVLVENLNDARFQTPTGATFKVGDVECAFALDSNATNSNQLAFGFLRPSVTHRNH